MLIRPDASCAARSGSSCVSEVRYDPSDTILSPDSGLAQPPDLPDVGVRSPNNAASSDAGISRRAGLSLLLGAGAALAMGGIPKRASAALSVPIRERRLNLHNANTNEVFDDVYWADGWFIPDQIKKINFVLRDHHTDVVAEIDRDLLDILHKLCVLLGEPKQELRVFSAYRTARTNAMLRRIGEGAAARSLHVKGMAMDFRAPGKRLSKVRNAGRALRGGGVGYYPREGFVHIDSGKVRYW